MLGLSDFYRTRVKDLHAAQSILANSWKTKTLPASHDLTLGRIFTPLALLLIVNLAASLLTSNGRYHFSC